MVGFLRVRIWNGKSETQWSFHPNNMHIKMAVGIKEKT